jgi:hypothetical protein
VASSDSRPKEIAKRLERILACFGDNTLADINTALCKRYFADPSTLLIMKWAEAVRDLSDPNVWSGRALQGIFCRPGT